MLDSATQHGGTLFQTLNKYSLSSILFVVNFTYKVSAFNISQPLVNTHSGVDQALATISVLLCASVALSYTVLRCAMRCAIQHDMRYALSHCAK